MAISYLKPSFFLIFLAYVALANPYVEAQVADAAMQMMTGALEWPPMTAVSSSSLHDDFDIEEGVDGSVDRRMLFWKQPYYISYGALTANRIPCPARSGRSYYTHNCFRASGPVHPYSRGCSAITRCRR